MVRDAGVSHETHRSLTFGIPQRPPLYLLTLVRAKTCSNQEYVTDKKIQKKIILLYLGSEGT